MRLLRTFELDGPAVDIETITSDIQVQIRFTYPVEVRLDVLASRLLSTTRGRVRHLERKGLLELVDGGGWRSSRKIRDDVIVLLKDTPLCDR